MDRPSDAEGTARYYRQKAEECARAAQATRDGDTRDQWLQLSNQWTYLALHAQRQVPVDTASTRPKHA
jgi:hypothetical protein